MPPKKTPAFSAATSSVYQKSRPQVDDPVREPWEVVTRKQKKRRRGIAGCDKAAEATAFHAADSDIFIYRVSTETTVEDIKRHIEQLNAKRQLDVTIKDLQCVSHPDCRIKSFRLTVANKDFTRLMRGDVWPPRVRVRRFIRPKSSA